MKKLCLFLFVAATFSCVAVADDFAYPYLVFTQADGGQVAVKVNGLEITITDGQLQLKNGNGTTALTAANLASMQFSATKGELTDGIAVPFAVSAAETIYDLAGRKALRRADGQLPRGIYLVRKADGSTSKVQVK